MHPKTKHEREQITKRKFMSRLVRLSLDKEEKPVFAFKAQTRPCSCPVCKRERYKREKFKPNENVILILWKCTELK
jgi:hypothetical protein